MTTSAYVLIIGLLVAIIAISIWTTTPGDVDEPDKSSGETSLNMTNGDKDRSQKNNNRSGEETQNRNRDTASQPGGSAGELFDHRVPVLHAHGASPVGAKHGQFVHRCERSGCIAGRTPVDDPAGVFHHRLGQLWCVFCRPLFGVEPGDIGRL